MDSNSPLSSPEDYGRIERLKMSMKKRVNNHNAALLQEYPVGSGMLPIMRRNSVDGPKEKPMKNAKVVLLGEPGVGKTTLVRNDSHMI